MRTEREIENAKIDLARELEFNVEDAFRLFELEEDCNIVNEKDMKYEMKVLGMNPNDEEINVFMGRFDLGDDGGIDYPDFF